MSLKEIEAELENLNVDELRHLALQSWTTFVKKENQLDNANECDEDDPRLMAALDEAIAKANASPNRGYSGNEVLERMRGWTSK